VKDAGKLLAYPARHPEKFHLVLFGAYGRGALHRDPSKQQA
jgi:hypothetical protein